MAHPEGLGFGEVPLDERGQLEKSALHLLPVDGPLDAVQRVFDEARARRLGINCERADLVQQGILTAATSPLVPVS